MSQDGALLETRTAKLGASSMQGIEAYPATLNQLIGDWMSLTYGDRKLPILACGMVGSKHGWMDVPYVACPATINRIADQLASVPTRAVHIVPGLLFNPDNAPPDIMRGEETQLIGALQAYPYLNHEACLILPGTHSKWAQCKQGQIVGFATHMTGELFSVLSQFSVLGRLLASPSQECDALAFIAGVDAARDDGHLGLSHQLFAVRSLGITEKMKQTGLSDYLSGLLIGHELRAGLAWRKLAGLNYSPLVLVGEPELCQRYEKALLSFELTPSLVLPNTAPAGLWHIAMAAKLV